MGLLSQESSGANGNPINDAQIWDINWEGAREGVVIPRGGSPDAEAHRVVICPFHTYLSISSFTVVISTCFQWFC